MVARHSEDLMALVPDVLQELAGLAELVGACTLREVAADHNEIGFNAVDLVADSVNQPRIMRSKMQVGQVNDASHGLATNAPPPSGFSYSEIEQQKQLRVHTKTLCALLLQEVWYLLPRDEMNLDILVLVAAALTDLSDAVRTHDSESFGQHSR